MAYIINKYNGEAILTLQDGTVDTSTSVQLVGRNYVGYGEIQNENFLFLLENFANDAPPARPLPGQTWFDTENDELNVYDGSRWTSLGTATISLESPEDPGDGFLWFKEPYNTLYVYNGTEWVLIGPDIVEGFGKTRAESTSLIDDTGAANPVIIFWVNDEMVSIVSSRNFTLGEENPIEGLTEIVNGVNVPLIKRFQGKLIGSATSAGQLDNIRTINDVGFNGTENITIKASTTNPLEAGEYLLGDAFDGSNTTIFSVDGTNQNIASKVVARDFNGDFAARDITGRKFIGQIAAPAGKSTFDVVEANEFIGQNISGTASAARKLLPGKYINDVHFDGTIDITIPASAETLTGSYINSTVTSSSLTQVGTLNNLNVGDQGITVGTANQFELAVDGAEVKIDVLNGPRLSFIDRDTALSLGGGLVPAIISRRLTDLGLPDYKFDNVHANIFHGEATSARFADLAEYYLADADYEPGTVLVFGGEREVTTTGKYADYRVAGVVSTDPGFIMNTDLEDSGVCIALQGRVPCKVQGPVKKGDLLTTAPIQGYAIPTSAPQTGTIIGKALEDDPTNGQCIIEISVGKM